MIPKNLKALVVDDMSIMRRVVKRNLNNLGIGKVDEAPDGKVALALIEEAANKKEAYQLIVCDWNMPNMTGVELLKAVRANKNFHNPVFVILTAESETQEVEEAKNFGVDSYIMKPFKEEDLKAILDAIFSKRKAA